MRSREKDLDLIPHRYVSSKKPLPAAIRQEVLTKRPDVVLFDIHSRWVTQDLVPLFAELKTASIRLVAIDSLLDYCDEFDLTLVPSFFVDPKKMANCHRSLLSGWDYYLLSRPEQMQPWSPGNKVLVLTGGSDTTNLGRTLPQMLDDALPIGAEVHWVQGPFAEPPRLPTTQRIRWVLHKAPQGLGALMAQTNYALTAYGVSFFELLQHGIPTVVFSPYGGRDHLELERLSRENIAIVAADGRSAVTALGNLMGTPETAGGLSRQAASKIDGQGALRLAQRVRQLVGAK